MALRTALAHPFIPFINRCARLRTGTQFGSTLATCFQEYLEYIVFPAPRCICARDDISRRPALSPRRASQERQRKEIGQQRATTALAIVSADSRRSALLALILKKCPRGSRRALAMPRGHPSMQ